jgi:CBS domain-containing protein
MTRNRIHRLVVVDARSGKPWPVGVLSMTDIITYGMRTAPVGASAMSLPPSMLASDIYEPMAPEPSLDDLGMIEDSTLVADVMHQGVVASPRNASVMDAARTMLEHGIHAVVVVADDGHAVGVVSQTDVVLARQGRTVEQAAALSVGDIMTPSLVSCTADRKLSEAITLMTRNRVHRLVVVDTRSGKPWPVGVLSMTDIITYGMRTMPAAGAAMSMPPSVMASDIYEPMAPEPNLAELGAIEDTTLVADVMHKGVVTSPRNASVMDAARQMLEHGIHAVVVVADDGHAVGVVSQTDVVLARQGRTMEQAAALSVGDIMTPSLVSCTSDRKLSEAITLMTRNRVHRLVVVEDKAGKLMPVGILSMTDVIRQFFSRN